MRAHAVKLSETKSLVIGAKVINMTTHCTQVFRSISVKKNKTFRVCFDFEEEKNGNSPESFRFFDKNGANTKDYLSSEPVSLLQRLDLYCSFDQGCFCNEDQIQHYALSI